MAFDPKWIRGDLVVKRDGTNSLTGNWDAGEDREIAVEFIKVRDADGLTINDSTGNTVLFLSDGNGVRLNQGTLVDEFSTDGTLSGNSDEAVPTEKAVKTYVDNIAGTSGTSGSSGSSGSSGTSGSSGSSGTSGTSGTSGSSGSSGTSGTSGSSGSSGTSGSSGSSGTSGTSGSSGSSGTSGTSGSSGSSGSSGTSGSSGSSGTSGSSANASRGSEALFLGDTTASITFGSPESNTNYTVCVSIVNEIDVFPSIYSHILIEKTINGFKVLFSGEIDSNNYDLDWALIRT